MDKIWTHLKLKNGDKVQFAPPAPDGEHLGGITKEERENISNLDIVAIGYINGELAMYTKDGVNPTSYNDILTNIWKKDRNASFMDYRGPFPIRYRMDSTLNYGSINPPIVFIRHEIENDKSVTKTVKIWPNNTVTYEDAINANNADVAQLKDALLGVDAAADAIMEVVGI